MPFHLRFETGDPVHCRFAVSPLWEVQEAVRTLKAAERHGYHLPWLRRARAAAAGLDLRPLWMLMPDAGHTPDFLCPPPSGPLATFEEELARVRAASPAEAADGLARSLADTPGAADSPQGRALLDDPERAIRTLADLVELAWTVLIAPDWPRLRALLEADVAYHSRRLADGGLRDLFGHLHSRLSWADGTLTVQTRTDSVHVRVPDGDGLVLVPSAFVWPDVVSGFEPPWQPTLVYPARGIGGLWADPYDETPDALATLLGRGRATVLTALAEPATTTALAHRLGLAPSSVSAHLSALRAAGLLASSRYGHQVLYERTPLGIALTQAA